MKINQIYLEASFISFVIHASIILYLLGFFYYESQQTSVLSKPIEVNLIFEEKIEAKKQVNQKLEPKEIINDNSMNEIITDETISFDSLTPSVSLDDLIAEDKFISKESQYSQVELYSSLIIKSIQSAWRKPMNIQDKPQQILDKQIYATFILLTKYFMCLTNYIKQLHFLEIAF